LAGGSGERFWPVSRIKKPKQLLPLNTEKTLIEEAVERIAKFIPYESIYVFTNHITFGEIQNVLRDLPEGNIIPEPLKRNTAPALAYAMSFITAKYGKEWKTNEILVGVFTSDQKIEPNEGFQKTVDIAFDYVSKFEKIATIGIVPTRPETAFGYIEVKKSQSTENGDVFEVQCFKEKPDLETAKQYILFGNYFWNSGMFFWRLDTFLSEAKKHIPKIYSKIQPLSEIFSKNINSKLDSYFHEIVAVYKTFPDISIDYALMEKTKNIVVVKSFFHWDDIGSWDALDRTKEHDSFGNVSIGNNLLVESKDCIVYNNSSQNNIKACLVGMRDVVVVVTDDAILVCPKSEVQKVKICVEELKKSPEDRKYL